MLEVDYDFFRNIKPQYRKPGQEKKYGQPNAYADCVCAFDIETTRIPEIEQSVMYIWQFAAAGYPVIIGREWDEFLYFLDRLDEVMLPDLRLVIFVHNLSFEFTYLSGIYKFKEWEVFCTDNRKVLYCTMMKKRFEFRCSYRLSNTNLKTFLKDYGAEHQKVSGDEFNYNLQRYSWTKLTDLEIEYCINDVRGLVEAVTNLMQAESDNFYSLPLTSTGYVRRDVKAAMYGDDLAKATYPDYDTYKMLRWAFRGGDTHANRWSVGKIKTDEFGLHGFDRVSSYPDVMLNRKYPVTKWIDYGSLNKALEKGYACLIHALFIGVELKSKWTGDPYIPFAKVKKCSGEILDNGRILSAEHFEICCTDIDYKIIIEQYNIKHIDIITLKVSEYGELPQAFKNVILDLYKKKTELKGVEGKEIEYMLSKNKINACYGMTVQDPVKINIIYKSDFDEEKDKSPFILDESREPQDILARGYKKAFLPYAVGVWVTAWARKALYDGMQIVGEDNFLYCDTDSIKFVGDADFTEFNKKCIEDDLKSGAYAYDTKGNCHYMGVFEQEKDMKAFCTLGAKKYAYIDPDGELHITVAGVNKKKGAQELSSRGGLEEFARSVDPEHKFTFYEAGGLEAIYNDIKNPYMYIVDGRPIWITSNLTLKPSTYTLGIEQDYLDILEMCENDLKKLPIT